MLPVEDELMFQSKNTAALCFCWCYYCKDYGRIMHAVSKSTALKERLSCCCHPDKKKGSGCCCEELYNNTTPNIPHL